MRRSSTSWGWAIVLAVGCAGAGLVSPSAAHAQAAATAPAVGTSAEEALRVKGLVKRDNYYLLADDLALPESLKAMRARQKELQDATRKKATMDNELKAAVSALATLQEENKTETAKLEKMQKAAYASYNRQVDKVNAIRKQIREGSALSEKKQKEFEKFEVNADPYAAAVAKVADAMDALAKSYDALAADADVKAALDKLNETAKPKVALGPSPLYKSEQQEIKHLRDTVGPPTGAATAKPK